MDTKKIKAQIENKRPRTLQDHDYISELNGVGLLIAAEQIARDSKNKPKFDLTERFFTFWEKMGLL